MTNSKYSDVLYGVDCDVMSCKYHGHDNRCFADSIHVRSPEALKKTETFCETYSPRPSDI